MITRRKWLRFINHPVVEWAIFGIGVLLLLISPIVGAIRLAMILKTSMWARRRYVRF